MDEELQALLQACKSGNEDKWNLLFSKYYPIAKRLVRSKLHALDRQTVDLLAQDAMLALHERIQNINDVEHLGYFVRTAVRNKCVDYIRRNKLSTLPITDDLPLIEEKVFLTEEKKEALHIALARLNEPTANLLRLRFMESLSYREIAARTGVDEAQVGMKLSRALCHLKRELAKLGITSVFDEV